MPRDRRTQGCRPPATVYHGPHQSAHERAGVSVAACTPPPRATTPSAPRPRPLGNLAGLSAPPPFSFLSYVPNAAANSEFPSLVAHPCTHTPPSALARQEHARHGTYHCHHRLQPDDIRSWQAGEHSRLQGLPGTQQVRWGIHALARPDMRHMQLERCNTTALMGCACAVWAGAAKRHLAAVVCSL